MGMTEAIALVLVLVALVEAIKAIKKEPPAGTDGYFYNIAFRLTACNGSL